MIQFDIGNIVNRFALSSKFVIVHCFYLFRSLFFSLFGSFSTISRMMCQNQMCAKNMLNKTEWHNMPTSTHKHTHTQVYTKLNVIMQHKDRNKKEKKILKIKWESNAEHIIEWFVNFHRITIEFLLGRRSSAKMNN